MNIEMIELDELPNDSQEGDALFTLDIFNAENGEVFLDARGHIATDEDLQRLVVGALRAVADDIEKRYDIGNVSGV
jgi:hypothetical protein